MSKKRPHTQTKSTIFHTLFTTIMDAFSKKRSSKKLTSTTIPPPPEEKNVPSFGPAVVSLADAANAELRSIEGKKVIVYRSQEGVINQNVIDMENNPETASAPNQAMKNSNSRSNFSR